MVCRWQRRNLFRSYISPLLQVLGRGGCTWIWDIDDCTSSQRAKDATHPGMNGAAPDQECPEENHIDLMTSYVILDSLQALLGLLPLGKKANKRIEARPGGESGQKKWWEPWAPGNQTWALWRGAERTASDVASCLVVMSSHLQPVL